ncbi:MAG: L,D-transpeptidase/peptidoglycan binding protein [Coriobacteriales bacterium]|nr:L,D-transpeptidase/peptidoglycan binding protein [Actinomycetes bacterium]
MRISSLGLRLLAGLGALVLFALTALSVTVVTDDYVHREALPAGASVNGTDLSGLPRAEAYELIEERVAEPLTSPVSVRFGDKSFELDVSGVLTVDLDEMLEEAFAPKQASSLPERVRARATGSRPGSAVDPVTTVDTEALRDWIEGVAAQVDTPSVDATLAVEGRELVVTPARRGIRVDVPATAEALTKALTQGTKQVELVVNYTEPKVTEDTIGKAILVRRSDRLLLLYNNGEVEKRYSVAVGTPGYPTPRGWWKIVQKRYMPTWSNPGSAWAKDMPKTIGPGPGNPLGTRALNLNAPGIRIHGTSSDWSIGTAASHGCMRMHMWDIEDLYDRVGVGTPVIVID